MGARGRLWFLLQAGSGTPACLSCIPFPSQAASVDSPLSRSARGEALPATHRAESAFRHHLLTAGTKQVVSPVADKQCSEQSCAGRQGCSTPLGLCMSGGESVQIRNPRRSRAATGPCPQVQPGARLSVYSQRADIHRTHIHSTHTHICI